MGLVQIRIQILQKRKHGSGIKESGSATQSNALKNKKICKICEMFMSLDLQIIVTDLDPRRIRMFLGILDPDPDPLVRGTDPDPDPSIIKQKIVSKTLFPTVF
jgi:hypothetical protein